MNVSEENSAVSPEGKGPEESLTLLKDYKNNLQIAAKQQPWLASLSELTLFEQENPSCDYDELKTTEKNSKRQKLLHCNILTPQFKIYLSHFLSSWGDRMWTFAGGLFLIEITPGSLRLVAIYHLSLSLTVILLGSAIGRWVDRANRLTAVQISLVVQNSMVCLCTLLLCILITHSAFFKNSLNGWAEIVAQVGMVLIACIAQIGNLGSKIAIEKDWIVVISKRNESKLANLNSVLRTIDLSTQILAPILVGFVMGSFGIIIGGIVIASWNVVSLIIEYNLLHNLFYSILDLRKPKPINKPGNESDKKTCSSIKYKTKDAALMWKKYFSHQIKSAGLALALLYMTVISLDNSTVAYLYENGVSKGLLGILTACASVSGILGSVTFPILLKRFGTIKTGIFGYSSELLCLTFCVVAMFAPGTIFDPGAIFSQAKGPTNVSSPLGINETFHSMGTKFNNTEVASSSFLTTVMPQIVKRDFTSVILLLIGIISSRYGLWLADLTVTQILQKDVLESERGGINGVQYSLNQSFSLLRSALLIILPTMATFGFMVILSFGFVATASLMFFFYAFKNMKLQKRAYQINDVKMEDKSEETRY